MAAAGRTWAQWLYSSPQAHALLLSGGLLGLSLRNLTLAREGREAHQATAAADARAAVLEHEAASLVAALRAAVLAEVNRQPTRTTAPLQERLEAVFVRAQAGPLPASAPAAAGTPAAVGGPKLAKPSIRVGAI